MVFVFCDSAGSMLVLTWAVVVGPVIAHVRAGARAFGFCAVDLARGEPVRYAAAAAVIGGQLSPSIFGSPPGSGA